MFRKSTRIVVLASVLVLSMGGSLSLACPMCKDSIPNSDAERAQSLPSGFNNSVYLLLCGFLVVTGTVSGLIVKAVRDTGIRQGFEVHPKK